MVLREAGGEAWVVLDDRIHEACLAFQDFRDTVESGAVRRGDTVEEVAGRAGVDADGLAATLAATARCATGDETDRFGRTSWEAPLAPPYEMIRVRPPSSTPRAGCSSTPTRASSTPGTVRFPASTPRVAPPPASPATAPRATSRATACYPRSALPCWRRSTSQATAGDLADQWPRLFRAGPQSG